MKRDVTSRKTMLDLQGDIVLLVVDDQEFLFTIIRFVDGNTEELQLVDKTVPVRDRPTPMPLTQAVLDNMVTIKHEKAKWKLVV